MTALGGPRDGRVTVRSLGRARPHSPQEITAVHLLGHPHPLEFAHDPQALTVRLPENAPAPTMPVLRVDPVR